MDEKDFGRKCTNYLPFHSDNRQKKRIFAVNWVLSASRCVDFIAGVKFFSSFSSSIMRTIQLILCFFSYVVAALAQVNFSEHFEDATLRVDYCFYGTSKASAEALDGMWVTPHWAGRRHHLDQLPLQGNGQIELRDAATQQLLYVSSFSTLFQEWLATDEAASVSRSFENVLLLPFPRRDAIITVRLFDAQHRVQAELQHPLRVSDILVRRPSVNKPHPHRYLVQSGESSECIDIAILAEGYTAREMPQFYADAQEACDALFAHRPFSALKSRFNVVAVGVASEQSGVSVPRHHDWRRTAFSSHFDTFYSDRYLTTLQQKDLHNALLGIPYEHIIVLANTEEYGGGGIYNAYTLTTAHHPSFRPVVVHEFGHSFGGLADEYATDADFSDLYPHNVEPWEPNITTLVDFSSKWQDLLPAQASLDEVKQRSKPTSTQVGLYEGAGYQAKGVFRPTHDCRMRTNEAEAFCPVCERHLTRLIQFYTEP